jgi:hypothetical protein
MKPLRQTICLWVIRGRHSHTTLQSLTQSLPKLTLKPHITVTNNLTRHTMTAYPVLKKQHSNILCRRSSHTWDKPNQPTKTIYNGKYTIIPTHRSRELCHEIHSDMLKRSTRVLYRFKQTRGT